MGWSLGARTPYTPKNPGYPAGNPAGKLNIPSSSHENSLFFFINIPQSTDIILRYRNTPRYYHNICLRVTFNLPRVFYEDSQKHHHCSHMNVLL